MSADIKKGGFAYPPSDYGNGMTLRQYYAAQALRSLVSHVLFGDQGLRSAPTQLAETAFMLADAMIEVGNRECR
jgi:hypothetical protein